MGRVLILGIGSPFADDQFGWLVADQLVQELESCNDLVIESVDRPGLNLLNYLNNDYERILLVDAVYAKTKPGTFYHFKAEQILSFDGFLSSHSIGVAPSLALAQALSMNINNVEFFGVEIERIHQKDEEISEVVKEAIPSMATLIKEKLGK
ncbi:hydrogenase maturation protease [Francisella frigiditurris]|uniref:Hydrogenase maturation protease family protein n=1 Tax=Francisella frigiditurris TaxID=1542390 RepID=A0A1J0KST2_9GAMM|nr:hydrogenase maturation protease [Francisella frigiditurris]APC96710.1 hydrogenase maturation protease family protein [Francisella frigiditurris]